MTTDEIVEAIRRRLGPDTPSLVAEAEKAFQISDLPTSFVGFGLDDGGRFVLVQAGPTPARAFVIYEELSERPPETWSATANGETFRRHVEHQIEAADLIIVEMREPWLSKWNSWIDRHARPGAWVIAANLTTKRINAARLQEAPTPSG